MIKNWSQSASSLTALVVKFSGSGTETLNFMLSEFKSKTQIYSKYKKKLTLIIYLSNTTGSTLDSIDKTQNGKF